MGRPLLLCNPTVKIHGETIAGTAGDATQDHVTTITKPTAHLVCYRIIPPVVTPSAAPLPPTRAVQVPNQFDKEVIRVAQPLLLCVPSTKQEATG